jgi:hypothetical protein
MQIMKGSVGDNYKTKPLYEWNLSYIYASKSDLPFFSVFQTAQENIVRGRVALGRAFISLLELSTVLDFYIFVKNFL